MALSDRKILEHLAAGDIVIDPFVRANLATSSYDVTLGEWFYREQPTKYNHSLYNIWDKTHVDHVWGAEAPERAVLAKEAFKKYNFKWVGIAPNDRVIIIRPGETVLAHTNEFIGGRDRITTQMHARSSLGRNFIEVCKCAGWGDVGYVNRWTMEITNNSRNYLIPLVVGRRLAQIIFFETGEILGADYAAHGKYQAEQDLAKLKKAWRPDMMLPRLWADRDIKKPIKRATRPRPRRGATARATKGVRKGRPRVGR